MGIHHSQTSNPSSLSLVARFEFIDRIIEAKAGDLQLAMGSHRTYLTNTPESARQLPDETMVKRRSLLQQEIRNLKILW